MVGLYENNNKKWNKTLAFNDTHLLVVYKSNKIWQND